MQRVTNAEKKIVEYCYDCDSVRTSASEREIGRDRQRLYDIPASIGLSPKPFSDAEKYGK